MAINTINVDSTGLMNGKLFSNFARMKYLSTFTRDEVNLMNKLAAANRYCEDFVSLENGEAKIPVGYVSVVNADKTITIFVGGTALCFTADAIEELMAFSDKGQFDLYFAMKRYEDKTLEEPMSPGFEKYLGQLSHYVKTGKLPVDYVGF